jgi:hypothetical protein
MSVTVIKKTDNKQIEEHSQSHKYFTTLATDVQNFNTKYLPIIQTFPVNSQSFFASKTLILDSTTNPGLLLSHIQFNTLSFFHFHTDKTQKHEREFRNHRVSRSKLHIILLLPNLYQEHRIFLQKDNNTTSTTLNEQIQPH